MILAVQPHQPAASMISVIIISKNEGYMIKQTVDSVLKAKCNVPFEIIVVDDGSVDSSCDFLTKEQYSMVIPVRISGPGIASARNTGAKYASGDYLVFCDAHIIVEDYWLDVFAKNIVHESAAAACPVISNMDAAYLPASYFDVMFAANSSAQDWNGCGKTFLSLTETGYLDTPSSVIDVPVVTGPCTMFERKAFNTVGGFGTEFIGYGWEEEEISLKLWTFGYRIIGIPDTNIQHFFRTIPPYLIRARDLCRNLLIMGFCHYGEERMSRLMEKLSEHPEAGGYLDQIAEDAACRVLKEQIILKRLHDDSWYMDRFSLTF